MSCHNMPVHASACALPMSALSPASCSSFGLIDAALFPEERGAGQAAGWHSSQLPQSRCPSRGSLPSSKRHAHLDRRVSRGQLLRVAALRNPLRVLPPSQRNITQQPKDSWGVFFGGENGGRKAPFENAEVRNSRSMFSEATRTRAHNRKHPVSAAFWESDLIMLLLSLRENFNILTAHLHPGCVICTNAFGFIPSEREDAKCQCAMPSRSGSVWGSVWV